MKGYCKEAGGCSRLVHVGGQGAGSHRAQDASIADREVYSISNGLKKLGLGTVQFGLDYGVTNERGQIGAVEASAIVDAAIRAGVDTFDTASAYGASEEVLGSALEVHAGVRVISKIPGVAGNLIDGAHVENTGAILDQTLRRLRRRSLYGLLLHRTDDLRKSGSERLVAFLDTCKRAGKVTKIGVSAYGPADVEMALERMPVDLVQLPLNLLDQRALSSGTLTSLRQRGVEVHVRSVFLQGVLLSTPDGLPAHFQQFRGRLAAVAQAAARIGTSRLALCLQFVMSQRDVDRVIVGVSSLADWREIVIAAEQILSLPADLAELASEDADLVNPSLWPASVQ